MSIKSVCSFGTLHKDKFLSKAPVNVAVVVVFVVMEDQNRNSIDLHFHDFDMIRK